MTGRYKVIWTEEAEVDLDRLFEFLLDRAQTTADLDLAQRALDEVRSAANNQLASTPYSFRKSGGSPLRRELVIPFGSSGYVALFQIEPANVIILAVRHQLESDYH